MKKLLNVLLIVALLLPVLLLGEPSVQAQSYPGPYDLVVLEDDPELIMEALAYIAAIHRLNEAPLPPILIYDGTNEDELQDFYDDYGPFDETVPIVLTVGTVPASALPAPSIGGWTWTEWRNHSQAGGENIDRDSGHAWYYPHYTRYLNNAFASAWPQTIATDWLRATQFGFHYPWLVPADAQIAAVEVQIARDCTATNKGKDDAVYLVLEGVEQGDNQASSAWWPLAANFEYEIYAWDGSNLSAADVRNSTFGVQLSAMPTGEYGTLRVDQIRMRVQHSIPPVAITINNIREWWIDGYEPVSISVAGSVNCSDGQGAAFQTLAAAETAISNFYTDATPRPFFPTLADAEDWEGIGGGDESIANIYYYGRNQDEAEDCADIFGTSYGSIVYRNERNSDKTLTPEVGLAYNMKEWLVTNVWEEADPPFAILMHQDDNPTFHHQNWYAIPIYALLRTAAIFPTAAHHQGSLTNCNNNGEDDWYWCLEPVTDEIHAWVDDGSGEDIWPEHTVIYGYVGSSYNPSTALLPHAVMQWHNGGNFYAGPATCLMIDIARPANERWTGCLSNSMTRLTSPTTALTILVANRGVFARSLKAHNRGMRGYDCGNGCPDAQIIEDYFGEGNYMWAPRGNPIPIATWLAYAQDVVYYNYGDHSCEWYHGFEGPGYVSAEALAAGGVIGPGVFVIDGCSTAKNPESTNNFVGRLFSAGAVAVVGNYQDAGNLQLGCYYADSRFYCDFLDPNDPLPIGKMLGMTGEAYRGCRGSGIIYGDPVPTLDDLTYWCNTHDCDDD